MAISVKNEKTQPEPPANGGSKSAPKSVLLIYFVLIAGLTAAILSAIF